MGLFYIGVPIAMIFGNPLSGFLLEIRTLAGLQGWQWMFFIEGLIAVVVGIAAYWYLDDRPAQASWIPAAEGAALAELLSAEESERCSSSREAAEDDLRSSGSSLSSHLLSDPDQRLWSGVLSADGSLCIDSQAGRN